MTVRITMELTGMAHERDEPDPSILCMRCHTAAVDLVQVDGRDTYQCRNCGHSEGRAIYTSGLKIEVVNGTDRKHFSVGALIRDDNRFLIIKRRVYPYKHGVPAGHVDVGETSEEAIAREVQEELGVVSSAISLVAHEPDLVGDKCRKGADVHDWKLYACVVDNASIVNNSDEAEALLWVTTEEANQLEFAFASGHMLRKVGLLG